MRSLLALLLLISSIYATIEGPSISIERVSAASTGSQGNSTSISLREHSDSRPAYNYSDSASLASHVGFFEQLFTLTPPATPSAAPSQPVTIKRNTSSIMDLSWLAYLAILGIVIFVFKQGTNSQGDLKNDR